MAYITLYVSDQMCDDRVVNFSAILEGVCPEHGTPLDRRDDCGWCDECGVGYSMQSDDDGNGTMALHMELNIPDSLRRSG